jgi:nitrite reductase (NADH) small subunit
MTAWQAVCRLDDIPLLGARRVARTVGVEVALFRTADDGVFALLDRCPHRGGPLSQGIVHGAAVTCPLHNWVISLETGKALGADEGEVRTIPVRHEDGRLFISLEPMLMAAE